MMFAFPLHFQERGYFEEGGLEGESVITQNQPLQLYPES